MERNTEHLQSLRDDKAARSVGASASRQALGSQIRMIRETISQVLHEDTTPDERLRTLFREK